MQKMPFVHHFPFFKYLFCLLVCVLTCQVAHAKVTPVIIDRDFDIAEIKEHIEFYNDETQQLTIDEIKSSLYEHSFTPASSFILSTGFSEQTYWLRFRIQNPTEHNRHLFLYLPDHIQHNFTIYKLSGDQLKLDNINLIPLDVLPHTTHTYYLKWKVDYPAQLNFVLASPTSFFASFIIEALLFGGLVVALIVALYRHIRQYREGHDRVALSFSVYITCILFVEILRTHLLIYSVGNIAYLLPHLTLICACLTASASLWFTRTYLYDETIESPITRWLKYQYLGILFLAPVFFVINLQAKYIVVMFLAVWVITQNVILGLFEYAKGNGRARLFLLAKLPVLFAVFGITFSMLGLIPGALLFNLSFTVTVILEIVLFTMALQSVYFSNYIKTVRNYYENKMETNIGQERDELLHKLNQEIRPSIIGIHGIGELLSKTSLGNKQLEYMHSILNASKGLIKKIDTIILSNDSQPDKLPAQLLFNVSDILDDCQEQLTQNADNITFQLDDQVPTMVIGTQTYISQALVSIIEYLRTLGENNQLIAHVGFKEEHGAAELIISAQHLNPTVIVEQPDITFDDDNVELSDLQLANKLVSSMNGSLKYNVNQSNVATFVITIPIQNFNEKHIHNDGNPEVLASHNALIVISDPTYATVLEEQCLGWNMEAIVVDNGKEALAKLKIKSLLNESFTIALIDQDLPDMSGVGLASKIKELDAVENDIILILMSDIATTQDEIEARNCGIRRILNKPVSSATLQHTLLSEIEQLHHYTPEEPETEPEEQEKMAHILVAEDDKTSAKILEKMLQKLHTKTHFVDNGHSAMTMFKKQRFDIILMDCEMPMLDGYQATEEIRAWEKARNKQAVPIIAMSAHADQSHSEQAEASGMTEVLIKPLELSQLKATLEKYV